MKIKDAVVLVTGANRGIGAALTKAFLEAGAAKVYAASRSAGSASHIGAVPVTLDVTGPDAIRKAAEQYKDVTILVNNAGLFLTAGALDEKAEDAFTRQIETNVFGPVRLIRAFAPVLKANGGGAVVNLHSVLSWLTLDGSAPFSASKAAIWAFTNGIRSELKEQKTLVTGVHLAFADTDMTAGINAPKVSVAEVASKILAGIEADEPEVLVDDTTRAVKGSFGTPKAAYLNPPKVG